MGQAHFLLAFLKRKKRFYVAEEKKMKGFRLLVLTSVTSISCLNELERRR
jgi:hypothetical protein